MRTSLGEIRKIIREIIKGSEPSEAYDHDLTDDESFKASSVLVPDDIKRSVSNWTKSMGLSRKKVRKASS